MPRRINIQRYLEMQSYVIHKRYHPNSKTVNDRNRDRQFAKNLEVGENGCLIYTKKGRRDVWLGEAGDIEAILSEAHLRGRNAHFGQIEMERYIGTQHVYWMTKIEDIKRTIHSCPVCSEKGAPVCRKSSPRRQQGSPDMLTDHEVQPVVQEAVDLSCKMCGEQPTPGMVRGILPGAARRYTCRAKFLKRYPDGVVYFCYRCDAKFPTVPEFRSHFFATHQPAGLTGPS